MPEPICRYSVSIDRAVTLIDCFRHGRSFEARRAGKHLLMSIAFGQPVVQLAADLHAF